MNICCRLLFEHDQQDHEIYTQHCCGQIPGRCIAALAVKDGSGNGGTNGGTHRVGHIDNAVDAAVIPVAEQRGGEDGIRNGGDGTAHTEQQQECTDEGHTRSCHAQDPDAANDTTHADEGAVAGAQLIVHPAGEQFAHCHQTQAAGADHCGYLIAVSDIADIGGQLLYDRAAASGDHHHREQQQPEPDIPASFGIGHAIYFCCAVLGTAAVGLQALILRAHPDQEEGAGGNGQEHQTSHDQIGLAPAHAAHQRTDDGVENDAADAAAHKDKAHCQALLLPEPVVHQHGAGNLGQQGQEHAHSDGNSIEGHRGAGGGVERIAGAQAHCGDHHDLLDTDAAAENLTGEEGDSHHRHRNHGGVHRERLTGQAQVLSDRLDKQAEAVHDQAQSKAHDHKAGCDNHPAIMEAGCFVVRHCVNLPFLFEIQRQSYHARTRLCNLSTSIFLPARKNRILYTKNLSIFRL